MIKKTTLFFSILFCILAIGCASGTALVTGTKRDAINSDEVIIYPELPENYEIIGIISASSDWGWTQQDCLNYAIQELKKQAVKLEQTASLLKILKRQFSMSKMFQEKQFLLTIFNL